MDSIKKIYELIKNDSTINTFNNNLDLFQEFYYHNMSIKYNGIEVIDIYKYLLALNISEEHETMPYINSKILEDFNRYEMYLTQSVYSKTANINDDYVELLKKLIQDYYEIRKYQNQGALNSLISDNNFIRDYTGAMMIILNSSFFNISNENIFYMMDKIKNNKYLQNVIEEGKMSKYLLDKDYIFQYTSRFLYNAEFINKENIENDILINAIKKGKIKDKDTLKKIFNNTNIYFLNIMFENGLTSFIDILEEILKEELDRTELFNIIYKKIIEAESYTTIIDFIIEDERHTKYISEEEKKKINELVLFTYPVNPTDEQIKYMLDKIDNKLYLLNLKENLKDNNWSMETIEKVKEITKKIPDCECDIDVSLGLLADMFNGKKEKNDVFKVFGALKRLIKFYLQDETIKVYLIYDKSIRGCASYNNNYIKLNLAWIEKMFNTTDYENDPESIHILETVFHEATHIKQFGNMKKENMNEIIYKQYKENIVSNFNEGYYSKNYIGVSYEKDARINGAKLVSIFLETNFPNMKECIKHYENKAIEEGKKEITDKKVFELSNTLTVDEILDKLIAINPSIIEEFETLKCEYNMDGSKKEKLRQI